MSDQQNWRGGQQNGGSGGFNAGSSSWTPQQYQQYPPQQQYGAAPRGYPQYQQYGGQYAPQYGGQYPPQQQYGGYGRGQYQARPQGSYGGYQQGYGHGSYNYQGNSTTTSTTTDAPSTTDLSSFTIKKKEKKKKGKKKKKKRGGMDSEPVSKKGMMMEMPMEDVAPVPAPTTKGKMMELPPEMTKKEDVTVEVATKKISTMKVEDPSSTKKVETEQKKKKEKKVEPKSKKPQKVATPKPNVEDDSDSRDHLNVVFIGHVDAGKSTISGQIMVQTDSIDKRTIEKFKREAKELNRESWFLAFAMDQDEEERAKGKTVEVGRASFETKKRRFTILDAPGHSNYVPNMIAGASQADVGVLVISARRGEFEAGFERSGQTREHAMLAKTLGVHKLVVLVNKMDEPTVKWNKARFDEIQKALKPFLRKHCGFKLRKDVEWLPMSGLTAENLKEQVDPKVCPWNESPPLLDVLDSIKIEGRDEKRELRVPILDKYVDRGVIAMGKVESGTLIKGQKIDLLPIGTTCEVQNLWIEDASEEGREANVAKPGENVRVRLKGINENEIHKGFVLCDECTGHGVTVFDARVQFLELLKHRQIVTSGYTAVMHCHTAAEECSIIKLINKGQGDKKEKRPKFVKSHTICVVRIKLSRKICVEKFADVAQLGQFTLRDEKQTIAVGRVLKILK